MRQRSPTTNVLSLVELGLMWFSAKIMRSQPNSSIASRYATRDGDVLVTPTTQTPEALPSRSRRAPVALPWRSRRAHVCARKVCAHGPPLRGVRRHVLISYTRERSARTKSVKSGRIHNEQYQR